MVQYSKQIQYLLNLFSTVLFSAITRSWEEFDDENITNLNLYWIISIVCNINLMRYGSC